MNDVKEALKITCLGMLITASLLLFITLPLLLFITLPIISAYLVYEYSLILTVSGVIIGLFIGSFQLVFLAKKLERGMFDI
jgi:hypothetical protein